MSHNGVLFALCEKCFVYIVNQIMALIISVLYKEKGLSYVQTIWQVETFVTANHACRTVKFDKRVL